MRRLADGARPPLKRSRGVPAAEPAEAGGEPEPEPEIEDAAPLDEAAEEEGGESGDAMRTYLRQMGGRALLTREGELALARRIEDGERRVLGAALSSPIALAELE